MIKVIFKGLERSEFAKEAALERMGQVLNRFPDLKSSDLDLTLTMQNSPTQPGPDIFSVKFMCHSGRYKGVILEKSASNFYKALADLSKHLLERLNRFTDKKRIKKINQSRKSSTLSSSEILSKA